MTTGQKVTTGVLVGTGAGLAIWGVNKLFKLKKKSEAAGKLELELDQVSIDEVLKSGKIFIGLRYKINFSVKNPTDQELGYKNLFVKISLKNKQGEYKKIADTVPVSAETKIQPQGTTSATSTTEVRFLNLIGLLDIVPYLIQRAFGAKATRDAKIDWSYNSEGLDFENSKIIKL